MVVERRPRPGNFQNEQHLLFMLPQVPLGRGPRHVGVVCLRRCQAPRWMISEQGRGGRTVADWR
jgi:hypothetical protein